MGIEETKGGGGAITSDVFQSRPQCVASRAGSGLRQQCLVPGPPSVCCLRPCLVPTNAFSYSIHSFAPSPILHTFIPSYLRSFGPLVHASCAPNAPRAPPCTPFTRRLPRRRPTQTPRWWACSRRLSSAPGSPPTPASWCPREGRWRPCWSWTSTSTWLSRAGAKRWYSTSSAARASLYWAMPTGSAAYSLTRRPTVRLHTLAPAPDTDQPLRTLHSSTDSARHHYRL